MSADFRQRFFFTFFRRKRGRHFFLKKKYPPHPEKKTRGDCDFPPDPRETTQRGGVRTSPLETPPENTPRGGKSKGEGPLPLLFVSLGGAGETGDAPPVADAASLFRGSGTIGGHEVAGNRFAATVIEAETPPRFWRGYGGGVFSHKTSLP